MTFSEKVTLQKYADTAKTKFTETETRITGIEGSFRTRMNNKSSIKAIGAMIFTFLWFILYTFYFLKTSIFFEIFPVPVTLICFFLFLVLIISIAIDEIVSFSYYKKLSGYRKKLAQLKNRVTLSKNAITTKQAEYMKSSSNGWNYPIAIGESVPNKIAALESTINGMETLKYGFIHKLKNIMYFVFTVAITVYSFVPTGRSSAFAIILEIPGLGDGGTASAVMMLIALVLTLACEIILAKIVWSKTNCRVTNVTLLITLASPLILLALSALIGLLYIILILAIKIILIILGLALIGATVYGCSNSD